MTCPEGCGDDNIVLHQPSFQFTDLDDTVSFDYTVYYKHTNLFQLADPSGDCGLYSMDDLDAIFSQQLQEQLPPNHPVLSSPRRKKKLLEELKEKLRLRVHKDPFCDFLKDEKNCPPA